MAAPEWEAMGVDLGIGVNSTSMPPPAPSHFYGGDLSFFPPAAAQGQGALASGSSSFNLSFADDFSIPSEEAAELEWLSNFIDDSYPDMPNYPPEVAQAHQQISNNHKQKPSSSSSCSVGGAGSSTGARTKRSKATSSSSWISSSSARGGGGDDTNSNSNSDGGVRRCTHCASEKTPQWRTGPLGPKTLCNACGVRYKSGRLVPEYRPAASPTFVLTQHSNSHRKVMELRRQKELVHLRGAPTSSPSSAPFRDYGIC